MARKMQAKVGLWYVYEETGRLYLLVSRKVRHEAYQYRLEPRNVKNYSSVSFDQLHRYYVLATVGQIADDRAAHAAGKDTALQKEAAAKRARRIRTLDGWGGPGGGPVRSTPPGPGSSTPPGPGSR